MSIKNIKKNKEKGFTLIEMLVAMTLFSFVITVALGALFMIIKANEKAKVLKMVVNNLNVAMEEMSREIRVGYKYNSDSSWGSNSNGAGNEFHFLTKDGCKAGYKVENGILKRLKNIKPSPGESCTENANWLAITGEDIKITNLSFNTTGIGIGDGLQPRVFILLKGEVGRAVLNKPEIFNLQTTISQRKIEN